MIEKFCLVIDEDDQSEPLNLIRNTLQSEGIDFHYNQFYPQKNIIVDTATGNITGDIDTIFSKININEYLKRQVDIVACDYNYGQDFPVNGFDVLLKIRENRKNLKLLLFSGNEKKIVTDIAGIDNEDERLKKFEQIFKLNAELIKREDYKNSIINFCRGNKVFDFDDELDGFLRKFGDFEFISIYPDFRGKKLSAIADILKDTNNQKGTDFKKSILRFMLDNLISFNDLEK